MPGLGLINDRRKKKSETTHHQKKRKKKKKKRKREIKNGGLGPGGGKEERRNEKDIYLTVSKIVCLGPYLPSSPPLAPCIVTHLRLQKLPFQVNFSSLSLSLSLSLYIHIHKHISRPIFSPLSVSHIDTNEEALL